MFKDFNTNFCNSTLKVKLICRCLQVQEDMISRFKQTNINSSLYDFAIISVGMLLNIDVEW